MQNHPNAFDGTAVAPLFRFPALDIATATEFSRRQSRMLPPRFTADCVTRCFEDDADFRMGATKIRCGANNRDSVRSLSNRGRSPGNQAGVAA